MATQRSISGVLGNFLGTYTSRYSDYDGYWLFGFLVAELGELRVDLLASPPHELVAPHEVAVRSAVEKFADQLRKAGLTRQQIREAWLTIRKLPDEIGALVNGHACSGWNLVFSAGAVTERGRRYEREQIVFVARHNAAIEGRSGRAVEHGGAADRGHAGG